MLGLWAYPANIVPLSFRLHEELAREHNGAKEWGYRRVNVGQIEVKAEGKVSRKTNGTSKGPVDISGEQVEARNTGDSNVTGQEKQDPAAVSLQKRSQAALKLLRRVGVPDDLDWVVPETTQGYEGMGTTANSAQVHPYHFTKTMARLAEEAGVKIITGARVTSINSSRSMSNDRDRVPPVERQSTLGSITYRSSDGQSHELPASHTVLAAGPWTQRLLPSAPISGLRAHSVTIRPSRPVSAYALFTSITLPGGRAHATPEIYARPDAEIYACGEGDTLVPLPKTTEDVVVDQSRCDTIVEQVGHVSEELRDGEVTTRQACYLPVCEGSGGPYIGEVREMKGLILAAGHSCWGIQNGPGTGKLVSEIIMDGKAKSAKLGKLDPMVSL